MELPNIQSYRGYPLLLGNSQPPFSNFNTKAGIFGRINSGYTSLNLPNINQLSSPNNNYNYAAGSIDLSKRPSNVLSPINSAKLQLPYSPAVADTIRSAFEDSYSRYRGMSPEMQASFAEAYKSKFGDDLTSEVAIANPERFSALMGSFNNKPQGATPFSWDKAFDWGEKGLTALGGLWNAYNNYQALRETKSNNAFQKALAQRNLSNQVADYNRLLEAKVQRAAQFNGTSADETKEYLNQHRLSDRI